MSELLQEWECVVDGIDNEVIYATMHDLTDRRNPIEVAAIYLDRFTDEQRPKLTEGRVFWWRIFGDGRQEFELHDPPPLTPEQLKTIEREAKELSDLLGFNR